jgi:hypothetical protein
VHTRSFLSEINKVLHKKLTIISRLSKGSNPPLKTIEMAKITPTKQTGKSETTSKEGLKTTLADLQANFDFWYKIRVLLHDLCNIANDRAAEARTLGTTDELYISAPYFTPDEVALIKTTMVAPPTLHEIPEFEDLKTEDSEI